MGLVLLSGVPRLKELRLVVHALGLLAMCCGAPLPSRSQPPSSHAPRPATDADVRQRAASARDSEPSRPSKQPFSPTPLRVPVDAVHGDSVAADVMPAPSPPLSVTLDPIETEGNRARPAGAVAGAVFDEQLQTWNVGGRSDPNFISSRVGYHPGTRVRVDATIRGARSKAGLALANRIQADFRNHGYWPFRTCYEDAARERPSTGGKTWLRATLRLDGSMLAARVTRTDLSDRSMAACLAKAARRIRIGTTRRRIDTELVVSVWPGDVPLLPLPRTATVSPPDEWLQTLAEAEPGVLACFRRARARDPLLWGRLALSFRVDEQGRACDVREYQSQFGDPAAVACVTTQLMSLGFPQASGEAPRVVAAWRLHPAPVHESEPSKPEQPHEELDSGTPAAESELRRD